MTSRSAVWTGVALAAIGIGGLIFTGVAGATGLRLPWAQGQTVADMMGAGVFGTGYGGMMGAGGGGEVTGGGGTGTRLINAASLTALVDHGKVGANIDTRTDTVTYTGTSATIVALASPHGEPNMTWEIDGLVNPTVVVRPGTQVVVDLVNTDWGYMHGFELTTTPPPYPYMVMMGISNDFLLAPLPERTDHSLATSEYYLRGGTVRLSPGTYYYLCPVPGHAQAGMHGVFEVAA